MVFCSIIADSRGYAVKRDLGKGFVTFPAAKKKSKREEIEIPSKTVIKNGRADVLDRREASV